MHLYGEYEYSIENNIKLNNEHLNALILLYQPIIGANAVSLFLSFQRLTIHTDYSNLIKYTGLDIDEVERGIIMLERYRLLKTYKHSTDNKYIHQLLTPLLPNDFLSHYVYGVELRKVIGTYQFNVLTIEFKVNHVLKENYEEITETKVFNQHQFKEEDLEAILSLETNDVVLNERFNYDTFLNDASELKFPSKLRTPENLNIIAELALFYGISEKRMATLVYRSIDYANMKFVTSKLIERVRREEVEHKHNINKYELPNVVFLQSLQNGGAVSNYNKVLLEELAFDMKLEREVINRLIEYVMETQNNRLVKNFVLQVAGTWKAYNIKTVEEANQLIKQTEYAQKSNFVKAKPALKRTQDLEVTEAVSDEEAAAIEEQWKKLGEKYGKTTN